MIQNCNKYRMLKLFLEDPLKGFKLREISRILKLGLPSVSNYIRELIEENLLVKKESYGTRLIFANKDTELFKKYKVSESLISLEKSGLIDFLEKELKYPIIILFGSLSKGEDRKESDIDICLITPLKKNLELNKFEKELKKEIQIISFTEGEFKKMQKSNKELFNNIINGIVLRGLIKT